MDITLIGDIEQPTPAIEAKRPCGRCGYELRGLPVTHACPECGLPFDAYSSYIPLRPRNHARQTIVFLLGLVVIAFVVRFDRVLILFAVLALIDLAQRSARQFGLASYLLIDRTGVSLADSLRGTTIFTWDRIKAAKLNYFVGSCKLKGTNGRTLLRLRLSDTGSNRNSWRIALRINELAKIYKDEDAQVG